MNPIASIRGYVAQNPQLPIIVHKYLEAEDEIKLLNLHNVDIWPEGLGNYNQ